MKATITWQHGNKYTKHWFGNVTLDSGALGKYGLSKLSGGGVPLGCYKTRRGLQAGIQAERAYLEGQGFEVEIIEGDALPVSAEVLADAIGMALDSGVASWLLSINKIKHGNAKRGLCLSQVPVYGGSIILTAIDGTERKLYTLDRSAIANGLKVMKLEYKRHYDDLINDNADAYTGDVLLQCSVYGQVMFG